MKLPEKETHRNLEPNSREKLHSLSRLKKRRREERRRICKPQGIVGEGGREHHWLRSSPWKQRNCHILEGVLWSFLKLWGVQQQQQAAPKPPPPPPPHTTRFSTLFYCCCRGSATLMKLAKGKLSEISHPSSSGFSPRDLWRSGRSENLERRTWYQAAGRHSL